jgi:hypothetical protein
VQKDTRNVDEVANDVKGNAEQKCDYRRLRRALLPYSQRHSPNRHPTAATDSITKKLIYVFLYAQPLLNSLYNAIVGIFIHHEFVLRRKYVCAAKRRDLVDRGRPSLIAG